MCQEDGMGHGSSRLQCGSDPELHADFQIGIWIDLAGTPLLQSRAQAARTSMWRAPPPAARKTKPGGTEQSGSDNWEMSFDWICHGYAACSLVNDRKFSAGGMDMQPVRS